MSIAEAVGSIGKLLLILIAHLTGFSLDSHGCEVLSLASWIPLGEKETQVTSLCRRNCPRTPHPVHPVFVGTLLQKVCSN